MTVATELLVLLVPGILTLAYTTPPISISKLEPTVFTIGRKSSRKVAVLLPKTHFVAIVPVVVSSTPGLRTSNLKNLIRENLIMRRSGTGWTHVS